MVSRLEKLEAQNRQLLEEVRLLRESSAPATAAVSSAEPPPTPEQRPTLEERVEIAEQRIDEQAQTKVEASQKFPVRLTGVVLFNAFSNRGALTGYTPLLTGPESSGASFRQTLIGLDFHGPALPGGGQASGSVSFDLSGSSASSYSSGLNLRRAIIRLDWPRRSVEFGQDKPLISRRAPDSLAEVLLPPLSYSGNPWVWVPQLRYTEHLATGASLGVDLETSVLETEEDYAYIPALPGTYLQRGRPAFETRVAFSHHIGDARRFEFAPGFHISSSHIAQASVPSRFFTFDWLVQPVKAIQITGLFAAGQNMANLGGFSDGFYSDAAYGWHAVRNAGGWTQVAVQLAPRLTWNSFAGLQAPRTFGLATGALSHDYSFASNLAFRVAPNILLGAEALQERSGYVGQSHLIRNHYDLALGYLF